MLHVYVHPGDYDEESMANEVAVLGLCHALGHDAVITPAWHRNDGDELDERVYRGPACSA